MSEQDKKDEQRRALSLRQAKRAMRDLMLNAEGLRRLRNISDEEWQEAVNADDREGA